MRDTQASSLMELNFIVESADGLNAKDDVEYCNPLVWQSEPTAAGPASALVKLWNFMIKVCKLLTYRTKISNYLFEELHRLEPILDTL